MYSYDLLEIVIATILGVNVGFYIGFVCGKEKTLHESKWKSVTLTEKPKYVAKDKEDKIYVIHEDKPFIIEDDDDIFLKINNDKEEIM